MFILHMKCAWSWELGKKYITFTLHVNCAWSCEMGNEYIMVILHTNCAWLCELGNKKKGNYIHSTSELCMIMWIGEQIHYGHSTHELCLIMWIGEQMHYAHSTHELCSIMWIGEQIHYGHSTHEIVLDRTNWQIEEKQRNYIHSTSELCSIMRIWEIKKLCWIYKGMTMKSFLTMKSLDQKKFTFILYIELWSIITIGGKQIMCVVLKYELCSYHSWKLSNKEMMFHWCSISNTWIVLLDHENWWTRKITARSFYITFYDMRDWFRIIGWTIFWVVGTTIILNPKL
jgi:hypothetical protein